MQNASADDQPDGLAKTAKTCQILRQTWGFFWANWLIFGFGLACVLGYLFPHVAARGGIIRSEYSVLYGAIGLIFLINGAQLSPEKLREHATNWRLHLVVQGIGLVLIPVIQLGQVLATGAILPTFR
ncbi:SBF-like CPA transporter family-domain-containing protein [Xylariaceae sp. FL0804]|nr:SBF-like CPA transporter family-domain-containing protein [Xylariaceae sp. FL0804]